MFESNYHLLSQFLFNVASMSAVNHHWVAVLVSQVRKIVKGYHTIFDAKIVKVFMSKSIIRLVSQGAAANGDMVKKTARPTIRSMHRTEEAPTLRKKFSDCSCLHLCEISSSVN